MINATSKASKSDPIPAGTYGARIYQIIHVGTITTTTGKYPGTANKAIITYELPTELKVFDEKKGEQPRVISQEYTLSFAEKASLRKVINACIPDAFKVDEEGFCDVFDIETLIGKTCLINVINSEPNKEGTIYAKVETTTPLPKGMTVQPAINTQVIVNYEEKWNQDVFDKLPDFIKDKMKCSVEYRNMLNPVDLNESINDIVPSTKPF